MSQSKEKSQLQYWFFLWSQVYINHLLNKKQGEPEGILSFWTSAPFRTSPPLEIILHYIIQRCSLALLYAAEYRLGCCVEFFLHLNTDRMMDFCFLWVRRTLTRLSKAALLWHEKLTPNQLLDHHQWVSAKIITNHLREAAYLAHPQGEPILILGQTLPSVRYKAVYSVCDVKNYANTRVVSSLLVILLFRFTKEESTT